MILRLLLLFPIYLVLTVLPGLSAESSAAEKEDLAQVRPGDTVVTTSPATVMDGPKTLGTLPAGTELKVRKLQGSWVGVPFENDGETQTGWVHRSYLKPVTAKIDAVPNKASSKDTTTSTDTPAEKEPLPFNKDTVLATKGGWDIRLMRFEFAKFLDFQENVQAMDGTHSFVTVTKTYTLTGNTPADFLVVYLKTTCVEEPPARKSGSIKPVASFVPTGEAKPLELDGVSPQPLGAESKVVKLVSMRGILGFASGGQPKKGDEHHIVAVMKIPNPAAAAKGLHLQVRNLEPEIGLLQLPLTVPGR